MQLIYTAEHLQMLWPCAPCPHSGKWRGTWLSWIYSSGAYDCRRWPYVAEV